jgi:hypothetical protein
MKLGRRTTQIFAFVLDELLPPMLRDRCWFMWPIQCFFSVTEPGFMV